MTTIEKIAELFRLTGAKSTQLDGIREANQALWAVENGPDVHETIEAAVSEDLASATKLEKRLRALAEERVQHDALTEVRRIAALQHDAAASAWVTANADDLLATAGKALQPDLDAFVTKAKELPKEVLAEGFPVTASWSGHQHEVWLEVAPTVDRLNEIKRLVTPMFVTVTAAHIPNQWGPWFAFVDVGTAHAGVQTALDATVQRSTQFSMGTTERISEWIALAHLVGRSDLTLALAGPTEAQRRLDQYVRNVRTYGPRPTPVTGEGVHYAGVTRG